MTEHRIRVMGLLEQIARACRRQPLGWTPLLFLALASGCGPGAGPEINLKSDDPAGRIPAMKLAAQRKDVSAAPELVKALESRDPAERLYSIEALRRITGQTRGYNYYDSEEVRAEAVARWKEWLSEQGTGAKK